MISFNMMINMLKREALVLTHLWSPNSEVLHGDVRTKHSMYLIIICELTIA